jgi:bifunctional non-homologous end joining protein LigD
VAGVRLTHPDRVIYAEQGLTKLDLAEYYVKVADWMLPYVVGRPLSLVRCPEGIKGPCFYQKQPPQGLPKSVRRVKVRLKETDTINVYVENLEGVLALVQFGALEIHAWQCRADDLDRPDRMVFDLDPGPGVDWKEVVATADLLRERLKKLSLVSFAKTTGGKGVHVVVPIERRNTWAEVKDFSRSIAGSLAAEHPDRYTINMSKAQRPGKIFIDYLRNERGATAIAPYSTRARKGAAVSMPVSWQELHKTASADAFTVANVPARLARRSRDPWRELPEMRQRITQRARKKVAAD